MAGLVVAVCVEVLEAAGGFLEEVAERYAGSLQRPFPGQRPALEFEDVALRHGQEILHVLVGAEGHRTAHLQRRVEIGQNQRGRAADALQPGKDLVAAGYVLYGASTMLVYSTGDGVHGFTLNPEYGEFLLSHPHLALPDPPAYYSVNASYYNRWSPGVQRFVDWLQGIGEAPPTLSARYIGSLVADFHRNLLRGGIFCYPAESMRDEGKLRLLYEAAPLAFLIEQANGYASNGRQSILELVPEQLHQRTALFIGNRWLVERLEEFIRQEDGPDVHFD